MSTITSALPSEKGISSFIGSHPIIAYFLFAFAGTWLVISPLVMDAFGLMKLSDAAWMLFYPIDPANHVQNWVLTGVIVLLAVVVIAVSGLQNLSRTNARITE